MIFVSAADGSKVLLSDPGQPCHSRLPRDGTQMATPGTLQLQEAMEDRQCSKPAPEQASQSSIKTLDFRVHSRRCLIREVPHWRKYVKKTYPIFLKCIFLILEISDDFWSDSQRFQATKHQNPSKSDPNPQHISQHPSSPALGLAPC